MNAHKREEIKLVAENPNENMKHCWSVLHSTAHCDSMRLIETCLSERKEGKGRISEETANTGVAFYLLGRWGVITANFNQFRSIIHGQGPSELISKMPCLSLSLTVVYELFRLHLHKELHLWYLISQLETLCNRECQLEMGKRVPWYVHKKKENKTTQGEAHHEKSWRTPNFMVLGDYYFL